MDRNDMSGTPGGGAIRRKPSYSEVLKATPVSRPAPIDTGLTRTMQGGTIGTATTADSGFWSAGKTSLGTGFTAPTQLFSPSIWSPLQQDTQSATIPRKLSWESTVNSKANGLFTNTPPQGLATGLGLQFGDSKSPNGNHANTPVTKNQFGTTTPSYPSLVLDSSAYQYKQQDIVHAQAKPFFFTGGVQLPKTAPLVQKPFYGSSGSPVVQLTSGNLTDLESTTTKNKSRFIVKCVLSDEGPEGDSSNHLQITAPNASDSNLSYESVISTHVEAAERDAQEGGPVLGEEAHPRNFARSQLDDSVTFGSAFPGAEGVVTAINPSHYCMEFGSRAICIKTDFVENIHWAIKGGKWAVMDKVAARIMTLYQTLSGGKDKVILIFSVNGQKSYCGLAEMAGPWEEAEGEVEGFKVKKDGRSLSWGTMPITWIFIKNISYYWFRDIRNPHSKQDVVNMWNGMHFPCHIAREVVETIIKRPHFTNVLAWRKDMSYDPFKPVLDAQQIDPLAGDGKKLTNAMRMIDNGRQGGHGGKGQALVIPNWRQSQEQDEAAAGTSTRGPNYGRGAAGPTMTSTTPPNLDGHSSPRARQGQIVQCYMDDNGNFVPVTPSGTMAKSPLASSNNSLIDLDATPRGVSPAFNQGSAPARGGMINHRGGRGGHATSRGNSGAVNSPRGALRVSSVPRYTRTQQSFAGYVEPQIRRMKSDIGLEDPFGNPRMPAHPNTMPRVMHHNANAHIMSNNQNAAFQRSVSSANFVPQNLGVPATTASSAAQSFGANASHGNVTPQVHAPAHSGGVILAPSPPYHTVDTTPSRMPGQGSVKQEGNKHSMTTLGDQQFFGGPVVQKSGEKSNNGNSEANKLEIEYLEHLRREAAIERHLIATKIMQSGGVVPDITKNAIAAEAKGD